MENLCSSSQVQPIVDRNAGIAQFLNAKGFGLLARELTDAPSVGNGQEITEQDFDGAQAVSDKTHDREYELQFGVSPLSLRLTSSPENFSDNLGRKLNVRPERQGFTLAGELLPDSVFGLQDTHLQIHPEDVVPARERDTLYSDASLYARMNASADKISLDDSAMNPQLFSIAVEYRLIRLLASSLAHPEFSTADVFEYLDDHSKDFYQEVVPIVEHAANVGEYKEPTENGWTFILDEGEEDLEDVLEDDRQRFDFDSGLYRIDHDETKDEPVELGTDDWTGPDPDNFARYDKDPEGLERGLEYEQHLENCDALAEVYYSHLDSIREQIGHAVVAAHYLVDQWKTATVVPLLFSILPTVEEIDARSGSMDYTTRLSPLHAVIATAEFVEQGKLTREDVVSIIRGKGYHLD